MLRIATRGLLLVLTPPCAAQKRISRTSTRRFASNAIKMEVKPGVTRIGATIFARERDPQPRPSRSPPRSLPLPRTGWIGTGVMGKSMVGHLMNAGYSATVYNRTPR